MQILRHSKITITIEIYREVPSAATRDALKKLGQRLGSWPPLLHFAAASRSKMAGPATGACLILTWAGSGASADLPS